MAEGGRAKVEGGRAKGEGGRAKGEGGRAKGEGGRAKGVKSEKRAVGNLELRSNITGLLPTSWSVACVFGVTLTWGKRVKFQI